jgi:2-dehydro-3-deoxy-D-arabinonate dehydratase
MILTRHQTRQGPRWALDGRYLAQTFSLTQLLERPPAKYAAMLKAAQGRTRATGAWLAPIETQEVWASGVTYLRSREARKSESQTADIYQRVYDAERPEIFFKTNGWRVVGHGQAVRIRKDSAWNVPEPELTLVINAHGDIVGYTAGNDMSSRDIEGANPLYLPQAKTYNGSCALGSGIVLCDADAMRELSVHLAIVRAGQSVFTGETSIARLKRPLAELVAYLTRELDFPDGVFLMTGTGIVPPEAFTLQVGDFVKVVVGEVSLENRVA